MALNNIQGLQGLTSADRQAWEKAQLSTIGASFNDYSEAKKDRLYRNQQFRKTFGEQEDYDKLIQMTPEARDRYYADKLFYDDNIATMTAEDISKIPAAQRDDIYNKKYVLGQLKNLYGDTDVWGNIVDESGNSKYETETLQEILRSGIKPESEIEQYEKYGTLGHIYNNGQKELADSDLALMSGTGVADNTTASRVLTRIKNAALGAGEGLITAVGTAIKNAYEPVKGLIKDITDGSFDNTVEAATRAKTPIKEGIYTAYGVEREWLRESNDDIWATINDADYQRKLDKGRSEIEAAANNLIYLANSAQGRQKLDEVFQQVMEVSPYYRQFKDTKYIRNLTYDEKAKQAAEAMYMLDTFGPERYYQYANDKMQNLIADSMNTGDRLANGAYDIYSQFLGGVMGFFVGQESIATGIADAVSGYDSNAFRQGFASEGTQIPAFFNPVYWANISQYGTMDWDEIKRIKYGVGEEAYQEYEAQKKLENPQLTSQEIEDMWIKEQYDQGMFRGDQLSRYTNVYKTTEMNDAFGLATLYGAAGMTGQVMSQALLAKGIGWIGRGMRSAATAAKMRRTANVLDATTPYAQVLGPTIPISEAYAQGAYDKVLEGNRETLENYLQTPEGQEMINQRFESRHEEYIDRAVDELRKEAAASGYTDSELSAGKLIINRDSPYVIAQARALAEEDERSQYYGHLYEGANNAFWTSFAIEAMRYGMFNMFNRQWIFGDASRKIRGAKPDYKITGNGAAVNAVGQLARVKDVAKSVAKEFWNSGRTNYCDELTTGFAVGIGYNLPSDYMGRIRQNNPEYDGVYGAILNGVHNMVGVADDPTSIQAFTTGALGFLIGGNPTNVATSLIAPHTKAQYSEAETIERVKQGLSAEMTNAEARQLLAQKLGLAENDYSASRKALEWATYLTGNSALLNVSQRLQQLDDATRAVNSINATLANNREILDSDKVIREMAALLSAREAASISGEDMTFKNANYMDIFHTLKTLSDMREQGYSDTGVYEDFMMLMRGYAEGRITDEDVSAFLHNPENQAYINNIPEEERVAYAAERIQKNAEKFIEVNDSWQRNKAIIDSSLGDLSKSENENYQDFYYDLLFKMSWSDDANQRLSSMENSISGHEEPSSYDTPMIQRRIANEGGNMKFVSELSDQVSAQISELKEQLSKKKHFLNLASKRKSTKAETISKYQSDIDKLQSSMDRFSKLQDKYKSKIAQYQDASTDEAIALEDKTPIRAEQLLRLNPEERLFVFTHPEAFSRAQQVQIEKARAMLIKSLGNDYLLTLRDVQVLQDRIALNDEYIAQALSGGNIQDAIDAISATKRNETVKAIKWLGHEKLKSLMPMLGNKVTKKLVSSIVGMPDDALTYAPYVIQDPNKVKVLSDAIRVAKQLQIVDQAIEQLDFNKTDKKKAVDMFTKQFMLNLQSEQEMSFLDELMSASNNIASDSDLAIYQQVINKINELAKQQASSQAIEETTKVAPIEEESKGIVSGGGLSQAEIAKSDESTGEFKSLTPKEIAAADPQSISTPKVPVVDVASETAPVNTQGTSMQGNWVNAYDVLTLQQTGKQVAKKGMSEGDTYNRWLTWTADNGMQYQNVVDFELARILDKAPNTPVHMIMINAQDNSTHDNLIGDVIMMAVEATDAVKRIHNDEYGHYITSRGKEYVIIGRAGIEKTATDEQRANYDRMYSDLSSESKQYFAEHSEERFCVSDKYSTKVRYVNGGSVTTALVGEQETTHDIADMLGDALRDPYKFNSIDKLGWYIQVGDKPCEPFGLPSSILREGKYYVPNNLTQNQGAVFVMLPAGNGKYVPVKVTAALLTNINDGTLRKQIDSSINKVVSQDYNTRKAGIMELLKTLVLNDDTNILIGTDEFNSVTIINGAQKVTYDLATSNANDIIAAINRIPFRINVNQTVFLDNTKMRQYAEAGVFRTDAAILACTGNNYSVYACDTEGNPMTDNAPVGNANYVAAPTDILSIPWRGNIARYKNGQWVVEDIVNGTHVINSPAEIQQLNYALQIMQQGLTPVMRDSNTGFEYFLIDSNPNNPIAVKRDNMGNIVVATAEGAKSLLDKVVAQTKNEAAKRELTNDKENEVASEKGRVMSLGEEAPKTPMEDNQTAAQQGRLFNLPKEETTEQKVLKSVVPDKNANKTETKTLLDLDMSEKSITFASLFNDAEYFESIYTALADTFGEDKLPQETSQYEDFLKAHNIPTVVPSVDALIDMIKNCR